MTRVIAGLGPVGLLAAMVLVLHDAQLFGLDVGDEDSPRPQWLEAIGGHYVDGREVRPEMLQSRIGPVQFLVEATGVPKLAFDLLQALGRNGVYIVTGIPAADRDSRVPAADLMRDLVLDNQIMLGSVNAAVGHFRMAARDLFLAHCRWPGHVDRLITHRVEPEAAADALHRHPADEIKAVVEWSGGAPARPAAKTRSAADRGR